MNDLRVGINADTDMRLYRFERNSNLPRDYFDPPKWDADLVVFAVILVCGIAGLWVSL